MKRLVSVLLVLAAVCTGVMAQEAESGADGQDSGRNENKWASITYYNVPIYKVLDSKKAFVVIYSKNLSRSGSGKTTIPKKWARGTVDNPRKLKFRTTTGNLQPFMTVVTEGGEFKRVILTMPASKANRVWGVAKESAVKDADKDTLEKLER